MTNVVTDQSLFKEDNIDYLSSLLLLLPKILVKYQLVYQMRCDDFFNKMVAIISKLKNTNESLIFKAVILISLYSYDNLIDPKELNLEVRSILFDVVDKLKDQDLPVRVTNDMFRSIKILILIDNKSLIQNLDTINFFYKFNDSGICDESHVTNCIEAMIQDVPLTDHLHLLLLTFESLIKYLPETDQTNIDESIICEHYKAVLNNEYCGFLFKILTILVKYSNSLIIPTEVLNNIFSKFTIFIDKSHKYISGTSKENEKSIYTLNLCFSCLRACIKYSPSSCSLYVDRETKRSGFEIFVKTISIILQPQLQKLSHEGLCELVLLLSDNFYFKNQELFETIFVDLTIACIKNASLSSYRPFRLSYDKVNKLSIFAKIIIQNPQKLLGILNVNKVQNRTILIKLLKLWLKDEAPIDWQSAFAFMTIFKSGVENEFVIIKKDYASTTEHIFMNTRIIQLILNHFMSYQSKTNFKYLVLGQSQQNTESGDGKIICDKQTASNKKAASCVEEVQLSERLSEDDMDHVSIMRQFFSIEKTRNYLKKHCSILSDSERDFLNLYVYV